MEVRVERGGLARSSRCESTTLVVLPLESCVVELQTRETRRLDRTSIGLVPADVRHRLRAISAAPQVLVLGIEHSDVRNACREYRPHMTKRRFAELTSEERVLGRTRWFDEIAQRYLFEREACGRHDSRAARFLEVEITKELFFLAREQAANQTRASVVHEGSDLVKRARAVIEHALFSPLTTASLARKCRTSESSLLRAFRRDLGVAPATFVRERRLDEALLMLESGRFAASEVATRVGYATVSAFSVAFSRRFGVAPSRVRVKAVTLPPEGARW